MVKFLKEIICYLGVIFLAIFFLVLTNNIDIEKLESRWTTVAQMGPFSFIYDNDSFDNIYLTEHADRIVGSYRQSRPVVLFFASSIFYTISSAIDLFENTSGIPTKSRILEKFKFQLILGIYIAINIFILALTFYFMRKILRSYVNYNCFFLLFFLVLMLILADDLVRVCIFSANYQMFHFLMPTLSVYWLMNNFEKKHVNILYILWSGTTAGILFLCYASFAILASAWALWILFREWELSQNARRSINWSAVVRDVSLYSSAFILIVLLWVLYLHSLGVGKTKMIEVENFRQFIWWIDVLRQEGIESLTVEIFVRLTAFIRSFVIHNRIVLIGLFMLVGVAFFTKGKLSPLHINKNRITQCVGIVLIPSLLFWFLEGLYIWRYLKSFYCLGLILIVCITMNIVENNRSKGKLSLALIGLLATFQVVVQLFFQPTLDQGVGL